MRGEGETMSGSHLDERRLDGLLRGRLDPAEARALADHLREPCELCERFLAGRGGVLDAMADRALGASAPRGQEAGDDAELARIMRAVGRRRARPVAVAAAVAAGLLAVAGATLAFMGRPPAGEDGLKGPASAGPPVRLRALLSPAAAPGAAPELERVGSGAEVSGSAGLLFRIEAGSPADLALVRVGPGDLEVVYRAHAEAPGAIDVSAGGKPAAYSLSGLSGRQRFVAIAGRQLDSRRLEAAAAALRAGAGPGDPRLAGLALDGLDVVVR